MRNATQEEIAFLENAYRGRRVLHGDLHEHANSGGTSDGKATLTEWKARLTELKTDFVAILDHRQVRHMYLPEWDNRLFVNGTEPGTAISDVTAAQNCLHYNMLLPTPEDLMAVLHEFPEYAFEGGKEGHFSYPNFTRVRFAELIRSVRAHGGFFVIPHPKQIMVSENDSDYWYADGVGMEVFYISYDSEETEANYALWTRLLRQGKRIWCCAGADTHQYGNDRALTTVYADASDCVTTAILPHLRRGDFTCGGVGFRMMLGKTHMGGECRFSGQKLIFSVGDFHCGTADETHEYRVDLLRNEEIAASAPVRCTQTAYFAESPEPQADYYRAELWDTTANRRIALSNPIWNSKTE